jgi:hypothetical protein
MSEPLLAGHNVRLMHLGQPYIKLRFQLSWLVALPRQAALFEPGPDYDKLQLALLAAGPNLSPHFLPDTRPATHYGIQQTQISATVDLSQLDPELTILAAVVSPSGRKLSSFRSPRLLIKGWCEPHHSWTEAGLIHPDQVAGHSAVLLANLTHGPGDTWTLTSLLQSSSAQATSELLGYLSTQPLTIPA